MKTQRSVWLNGKMIPWAQATVPILSHGFSRGSAIFEFFRIHSGPEGPAAFRMDEHLRRLEKSAALLEMELGYNSEEIARAVAETVKANDMDRGLIKIMAYWGKRRSSGWCSIQGWIWRFSRFRKHRI